MLAPEFFFVQSSSGLGTTDRNSLNVMPHPVGIPPCHVCKRWSQLLSCFGILFCQSSGLELSMLACSMKNRPWLVSQTHHLGLCAGFVCASQGRETMMRMPRRSFTPCARLLRCVAEFTASCERTSVRTKWCTNERLWAWNLSVHDSYSIPLCMGVMLKLYCLCRSKWKCFCALKYASISCVLLEYLWCRCL